MFLEFVSWYFLVYGLCVLVDLMLVDAQALNSLITTSGWYLLGGLFAFSSK